MPEVYETLVAAESHKWIRTAQRNAEPYFYRTRSGLELDLLLVLEGGVIGVEIKGRKTLVSSDLRPMREIAGALKQEWSGGIVVYEGDTIVKMGEPSLWAVPARRLFI